MKVLIVGGGIGGLATALACEHFNIDYKVFEASPEIREAGAGIWVPPNAMQIMHRLGLSDAIVANGRLLESISIGPVGSLHTMQTKDVVTKFGFGVIAIHRARLLQTLYKALPISKVHTGKRLKDFVAGQHSVTVTFEDGTQATGDCLVGADGLRSRIRRQLFGDLTLRYSGQTCWRGIVRHQLPHELRSSMRELWGKRAGQRFAYSQISTSELYYYSTLATPAHGHDDYNTVKATLLDNFKSFGVVAVDIIASIDPATVLRTDLYDLKPIRLWVKGNVALLGDAAHATTPNLGQGAAQAIEDAFALVATLKKQSENISAAFARYQELRWKKANYVVNASWRIAQLLNMRNSVSAHLQDWILRATPASVTNRQIEKVYQVDFEL